MAFDTKKNILLEKQYFYVKAQKGFKLQGTSTEIIPTNTGFYRFLVSNLTFALGNSYVDVIYDSTDLTFQAYCSDLFMENVQNTVTVAVENMNVDLAHFAQQNHSDITLFATQVGEDFGTLGNGISAGLKQVDDDVKATGDVAHEDAQAIKDAVDNIDLSPVTAFKDANHTDIEELGATVGTALGAVDADIKSASELAHNDSSAFKDANHADLEDVKAKIPSVSGLALDATLSALATALGTALQAVNTNLEAVNTGTTEIPNFKAQNHEDVVAVKNSVGSVYEELDTIFRVLGDWVKPVLFTAFKDANHTDLTALLTAFNSLAEELKKKLANVVSLDSVGFLQRSSISLSAFPVGSKFILKNTVAFTITGVSSSNRFRYCLLPPYGSGFIPSGYVSTVVVVPTSDAIFFGSGVGGTETYIPCFYVERIA